MPVTGTRCQCRRRGRRRALSAADLDPTVPPTRCNRRRRPAASLPPGEARGRRRALSAAEPDPTDSPLECLRAAAGAVLPSLPDGPAGRPKS